MQKIYNNIHPKDANKMRRICIKYAYRKRKKNVKNIY